MAKRQDREILINDRQNNVRTEVRLVSTVSTRLQVDVQIKPRPNKIKSIASGTKHRPQQTIAAAM